MCDDPQHEPRLALSPGGLGGSNSRTSLWRICTLSSSVALAGGRLHNCAGTDFSSHQSCLGHPAFPDANRCCTIPCLTSTSHQPPAAPAPLPRPAAAVLPDPAAAVMAAAPQLSREAPEPPAQRPQRPCRRQQGRLQEAAAASRRRLTCSSECGGWAWFVAAIVSWRLSENPLAWPFNLAAIPICNVLVLSMQARLAAGRGARL